MGGETVSIHVLSDSLGETGEMVARAAMSQFEPTAFRIERLPRIDTAKQLRETVKEHCGGHCLFLYTLVEPGLRAEMELLCDEGVNGVDLLGPAVAMLGRAAGITPIGEAGVQRRTDEKYFDRIEAMEFAVKHDDGRNPEGLLEADVVLIGVSRTSKTPLSMYLAFRGIRAANVPLALGTEPPAELFQVDPRRVFGLVSDPNVLLDIRRERMRELGTWVHGYADRETLEREMEEARALMRRIGCIVIRTDNRAMEETAQDVLRHLGGRLATED
jgi:[pyruvate, water dikinase]-phosphate phosphotransferase / [pyruvate, water dikinase] kinase